VENDECCPGECGACGECINGLCEENNIFCSGCQICYQGQCIDSDEGCGDCGVCYQGQCQIDSANPCGTCEACVGDSVNGFSCGFVNEGTDLFSDCPVCQVCNGAGACVNIASGDPDPNGDCPNSGDVCCADGQGGMVCQVGPTCGCDSNAECTDPDLPVCDTTDNVCVECLTAQNCVEFHDFDLSCVACDEVLRTCGADNIGESCSELICAVCDNAGQCVDDPATRICPNSEIVFCCPNDQQCTDDGECCAADIVACADDCCPEDFICCQVAGPPTVDGECCSAITQCNALGECCDDGTEVCGDTCCDLSGATPQCCNGACVAADFECCSAETPCDGFCEVCYQGQCMDQSSLCGECGVCVDGTCQAVQPDSCTTANQCESCQADLDTSQQPLGTFSCQPAFEGEDCGNCLTCQSGTCATTCSGTERCCPDPAVDICVSTIEDDDECCVAADCDDGNVCTTDTCPTAGGVCEHTPITDGPAPSPATGFCCGGELRPTGVCCDVDDCVALGFNADCVTCNASGACEQETEGDACLVTSGICCPPEIGGNLICVVPGNNDNCVDCAPCVPSNACFTANCEFNVANQAFECVQTPINCGECGECIDTINGACSINPDNTCTTNNQCETCQEDLDTGGAGLGTFSCQPNDGASCTDSDGIACTLGICDETGACVPTPDNDECADCQRCDATDGCVFDCREGTNCCGECGTCGEDGLCDSNPAACTDLCEECVAAGDVFNCEPVDSGDTCDFTVGGADGFCCVDVTSGLICVEGGTVDNCTACGDDCDDNNPCTIDSCEVVSGVLQCVNTQIDCGDCGECIGGTCFMDEGINCGGCGVCAANGSGGFDCEARDSNFECRIAGANETCDPAEFCDGESFDCPANDFAALGTDCGTCQECDGSGSCETVIDGTPDLVDCATGEVCCGGLCTPLGTLTNCSTCGDGCADSTVCTTDTCEDDGSGGFMCVNTPITCDDNFSCTVDSCDSVTGCVFTENDALCPDCNVCEPSDPDADGTTGCVFFCDDTVTCCTETGPDACLVPLCNSDGTCTYTATDSLCGECGQCTSLGVCQIHPSNTCTTNNPCESCQADLDGGGLPLGTFSCQADFEGTDCGDCLTCQSGTCATTCSTGEFCCPGTDTCVPTGETCCDDNGDCTVDCEICGTEGYCVVDPTCCEEECGECEVCNPSTGNCVNAPPGTPCDGGICGDGGEAGECLKLCIDTNGNMTNCFPNTANDDYNCCRAVGGTFACKPGSGGCFCDVNSNCQGINVNQQWCCDNNGDGFGDICGNCDPGLACVANGGTCSSNAACCSGNCPPVAGADICQPATTTTTAAFAIQASASCTPLTCDDLPCGNGQDDGCGNSIDCGECCTPRDFCNEGECGTVSDGCDGTIDCGGCTAFPNSYCDTATATCACAAATCESLGGACGTSIDDGCGAEVYCGDCPVAEPVTTPAPGTCFGEGVVCVADSQCCEGLCRGRNCKDQGRKICQSACVA
jgi:hypothetical protein